MHRNITLKSNSTIVGQLARSGVHAHILPALKQAHQPLCDTLHNSVLCLHPVGFPEQRGAAPAAAPAGPTPTAPPAAPPAGGPMAPAGGPLTPEPTISVTSDAPNTLRAAATQVG